MSAYDSTRTVGPPIRKNIMRGIDTSSISTTIVYIRARITYYELYVYELVKHPVNRYMQAYGPGAQGRAHVNLYMANLTCVRPAHVNVGLLLP